MATERHSGSGFKFQRKIVVDFEGGEITGDAGLMLLRELDERLGLTGGLGKLVAFWDNNHISIDGHTEGWFNDDTPARFEAYGWHVQRIDGQDVPFQTNGCLMGASFSPRQADIKKTSRQTCPRKADSLELEL